MSGRHAGGHRHLHVHGAGPVHRLAPEAKLLALVVFVVAVALTPRSQITTFAVDALILVVVAGIARLRAGLLLRRLAVIAPFVVVAVTLPFLGDGEQTRLLGMEVSRDGLWAAWNIVAKATLGAGAGIVVTATTPVPDLLTGLRRLRVPAVFVEIVAFMVRYLDLVVDEFARTRRAMTARGHDPRWLWQARPIAASAGTLFVRTYERGERVHDAMVSRGYTGSMPELDRRDRVGAGWIVVLAPGLIASGLALATALA